MEDTKRAQLAERVILVGLGANMLLAAVKTTVGLTSGSQALLADGVNSTSDVIYLVATLILVRMAAKAPDAEHPHGYVQSESIASLLIGAFIVTTAVAILYNSVSIVFTGGTKTGDPTALAVAAGTIVSKVGLMLFSLQIGYSTGNKAISAIAADHRNDIFAASAVLVGTGGAAFLGLPILDPLAGVVVSYFIFTTGLGIIREAIEDLMGTLPKGGLARDVAGVVNRVQGVCAIDDVRAYRVGPYYVLNLEIEVDPRLSVEQGHAIATAVEQTLVTEMQQVRHVYTHVNPSPPGHP